MNERIKTDVKPMSVILQKRHADSSHREAGPGFAPGLHSPYDRLLRLQTTIGNQAVQALFRTGMLQAKLTVGQPDDVHEREADRLADTVMAMPDPAVSRQSEEEEEMLQMSPLSGPSAANIQMQPEEEEELLQAKGASDSTPEVESSLESEIQGLRGAGSALPHSVRNYFEPRFGCDFSQVRVHSNTQAANIAQTINAKAFTIGQDVVFNAGQYTPGTSDGDRLLAHELTHVIQQEPQR
jgi:hypothetical protein